jgi:hypothetical protein
MNKTTKPEKSEPFSIPGWPIGEVGTEAVHQFLDRGQTVAKMLVDWNAEFAQLMGHRVNQLSESIRQMAQCRSLPQLLEAEGQWFKRACDDYSKEASKLMEVTGKLYACLGSSVEQLQPNPSGVIPSPAVTR